MKLTENMLPDLEMFLNLYYLKIIRFNIHTGEYSIILDNCSLWNGDYYHILELLRDCPVHPDDVDDYNKNINLEDIEVDLYREFDVRVKVGDRYYLTKMIFAPSLEEEDIFYFFVKEVELIGL